MIEVTSFKPFQKSSLQGFAVIRMTNIGLEVRDVTLHQKNGKRWLQLPSKNYQPGLCMNTPDNYAAFASTI
jgi:hypothetical protein